MSKQVPARRPNEKLSNLILEGGKGQRYPRTGAYEVADSVGKKISQDSHKTVRSDKRSK